MDETVIVSGVRTPIGSFNGSLSQLSAVQLGAAALREAVNKAEIKPDMLSEVIMGCVLQGGLGQAPARQASLGAGIPASVTCMTVNKVCSSGLKSVMLGAQSIMAGDSEIVAAGGMESMTNAPYYLLKARSGYRMGNDKIIDGMIFDGLWDPYGNTHMGNIAELCAREYKISREQQDAYAKRSYEKALEAIKNGHFSQEIVNAEIKDRKGKVTLVSEDEEPGKGNIEKGLQLKPAFEKEGTVTAFNASKINDGAAALVLMSGTKASSLGKKPLAKILAQATYSDKPEWFTTAPGYVIDIACKKAGLKKEQIDLFEINEAFAVVSLAVNKIAGLDESKVNISGGAIAFGHPIGASGSRILVTLLHNLKRTGGKYGIAALCNGGGEATAVVIEAT